MNARISVFGYLFYLFSLVFVNVIFLGPGKEMTPLTLGFFAVIIPLAMAAIFWLYKTGSKRRSDIPTTNSGSAGDDREQGQSLVEYALILVLVAVAVIVACLILGSILVPLFRIAFGI